MSQCKASHERAGTIWFCTREAGHSDMHRDDDGCFFASLADFGDQTDRIATLERENAGLRGLVVTCLAILDGSPEYDSLTEQIRAALKSAKPAAKLAKVRADALAERGWVACSERMPTNLRPVLVVHNGATQWISYRWARDHWEPTEDGIDDAPADAFSHWQPLPAPPEPTDGR
jgi:hypothetical protein